ncbi:uncharacterized protein BDCG_17629 [Blastomyces dermatitidis ER-3]|uniref:Uncharacterized protein n=1 Tax=Ajellomyces dermatitidis (strain ER-3 / ATCC MYA-2586) TaxID=559297 RepID=A0ABX2VZK0_AJEDR|nr:uncharacterized protein BDCG_17629 [Blastomyces dermatitidis ER-3]OAT02551.1 hypothetical protein BDCG_17629 [Blastomyces dermatitidis ER-3]
MAVREAENRLDTDAPAGRRDDTSLQGMATITLTAREAGEDVTMRVILSQLIDITSTFNLTFLMIMETAAALQRHLLTRKYQNKLFIILQE